MGRKTIKMWVKKTDIRKIRPAEDEEMVAPGQFSKPGDMIVVGRDFWEEDFLIEEKDFPNDYISIRVPIDYNEDYWE